MSAALHCYETLVRPGREAARFAAAFFRYVELNAAAAADGPMIVHSTPEGELERKTVILWSPAAAAGFAAMWRGLVA